MHVDPGLLVIVEALAALGAAAGFAWLCERYL